MEFTLPKKRGLIEINFLTHRYRHHSFFFIAQPYCWRSVNNNYTDCGFCVQTTTIIPLYDIERAIIVQIRKNAARKTVNFMLYLWHFMLFFFLVVSLVSRLMYRKQLPNKNEALDNTMSPICDTLNCQIRQELSHRRIQLRKQSAKMNERNVCVRGSFFFTRQIDVTTFRVGDNESDQRREQQHEKKAVNNKRNDHSK